MLWASRSLSKIEKLIEENGFTGVTAVTYDVALEADIIIHSMWFRDLIPWAQENKEKLAGKLLVDIVNPFTEDFNNFTTDWNTSAAEGIAGNSCCGGIQKHVL
jgi:predicted dinucleotide-binding enzyme